MKYLPALLLFIFPVIGVRSQTTWFNPLKADHPVIQNQAWTSEIGKTFTRLPVRMKDEVRKPVWDLSQNTAGLAIHFYTNATKITVRYQVSGSHSMNHMPATGKSGLDLYAIGPDGQWMLHTDKFLFEDTIKYIFNKIDYATRHKNGYEFRLFLPLYNDVRWLEIGVPDTSSFKFIPVLKDKPIVVYGTSIAQGGCASRPGMGWTNILSRTLDWPVVNLAFSGNGPLEKVIVDHINEIDAKVYIYDCLPNMGALSEAEVFNRVVYGVKEIRKKHIAPILLVDHIGYMNDQLDRGRQAGWQKLNDAQQRAYDTLMKQGVKGLYYLSKDQLNFPADGCVDAVHPNDLGMQAYANAYARKIREILQMPIGTIPTTIPVSQRREPYIYEWKERHSQILESHQNKKFENIVIGNSIVHYWNEPQGNLKGGKNSWGQYLGNFQNLGYGWDRIENVLWRVQHGELDGFTAKKIVVAIGTNNVGVSSDEDIVTGLETLLKQIKSYQPAAQIKMMGILPRRNTEKNITDLNRKIRTMAEKNGFRYDDAGKLLLLSTGKIDETLFYDGLHPNEKGYMKIAPVFAR